MTLSYCMCIQAFQPFQTAALHKYSQKDWSIVKSIVAVSLPIFSLARLLACCRAHGLSDLPARSPLHALTHSLALGQLLVPFVPPSAHTLATKRSVVCSFSLLASFSLSSLGFHQHPLDFFLSCRGFALYNKMHARQRHQSWYFAQFVCELKKE